MRRVVVTVTLDVTDDLFAVLASDTRSSDPFGALVSDVLTDGDVCFDLDVVEVVSCRSDQW